MDPPIVWEVSGSVDVNGGVAWLSPGACGLAAFAWIVRDDDQRQFDAVVIFSPLDRVVHGD